MNIRRKTVKLFVVVSIVGALLPSCSATRSQLQYLDSPPPNLSIVPACGRVAGSLQRLELRGQRCMALVRAADWYSLVPIEIRAGERYAFQVAPGQFWFDKTERIEAPRGVPGSGLKLLAAGLKRHTASGWFALMATTVAPRHPGKSVVAFDVGMHQEVTFAEGGQLAMYPNDARSLPINPEYFYENNHGQVWVKVERL